MAVLDIAGDARRVFSTLKEGHRDFPQRGRLRDHGRLAVRLHP